MLLSVTIENFLSFKEALTFSMSSTRELLKKERLPYLKNHDVRLLPIASIYGGNASGKSNFVKALITAKNLVTKGTQIDELLPVETFLLDQESLSKPSLLTFVISTQEKLYEYGFKVTRNEVVEEWLIEILKTRENEIFRRQQQTMNWHSKLENEARLQLVFENTRANQLFLTNSVNQNIVVFKPVYDWFKEQLVIIVPETKFHAYNELVTEGAQLNVLINEALQGLDTGITRLGEEPIAFNSLPLPTELKEQLRRMPVNSVTNVEVANADRYVIHCHKNGEIQAAKVVSYHRSSDGSEKKFEFGQESDGTRRVIDLLPAFIEASRKNQSRVFVIDELDRSLHSVLTRKLLRAYLHACGPDSRSQLIFTTHDLMLMDQNILRRDEMWVMERNEKESTQLYAISDYKDVRYDKDIRKSYMQGRFGGVPRILLDESFALEQNDIDAAMEV